jgi:hypothetical protein
MSEDENGRPPGRAVETYAGNAAVADAGVGQPGVGQSGVGQPGDELQDAEQQGAGRPRGGRPGSVRWSAALGRTICARVAAGEVLYVVLREPGMPTPQSVRTWARERADFGACLAQARADGGRAVRGGGVWRYSPAAGEAIFARLCEGESLTAIGDDALMPCLSTIFHWRRCIPEFEELVQEGRAIQAERFCDLGWDLAMQATPETAYLTHVRLTQLRWTAGVMAPRVFRLKPVEPATAPPVTKLAIRRFEVEVDKTTGAKKVVSYFPNPETGEVERQDAPGWRRPAGVVSLPG